VRDPAQFLNDGGIPIPVNELHPDERATIQAVELEAECRRITNGAEFFSDPMRSSSFWVGVVPPLGLPPRPFLCPWNRVGPLMLSVSGSMRDPYRGFYRCF
jgi:hypothetical protein